MFQTRFSLTFAADGCQLSEMFRFLRNLERDRTCKKPIGIFSPTSKLHRRSSEENHGSHRFLNRGRLAMRKSLLCWIVGIGILLAPMRPEPAAYAQRRASGSGSHSTSGRSYSSGSTRTSSSSRSTPSQSTKTTFPSRHSNPTFTRTSPSGKSYSSGSRSASAGSFSKNPARTAPRSTERQTTGAHLAKIFPPTRGPVPRTSTKLPPPPKRRNKAGALIRAGSQTHLPRRACQSARCCPPQRQDLCEKRL